MAEYIEREALKQPFECHTVKTDGELYLRLTDVATFHESIPAADVEPVRHGRWIVDDADSGEFGGYSAFIEFHCPFCNEDYSLENGQYGWIYGDDIPFKFCHNCGAKMDATDINVGDKGGEG